MFGEEGTGVTGLRYPRRCEKGYLCVAKLLVERDMVLCRDALGWTQAPMHIALHCGYAVVVSFLINCGADLDAEEGCRATPLYWRRNIVSGCTARLHCRFRCRKVTATGDIVRLLLGHGADELPLI